jgi:acyl-CoA synthetase (AMP-forming)/AMP-acid ligase II
MSHGSGLYIMAQVMRLAVNVVPESGAFEPEEVFRLFGAWPRASMFAAPTMVKRLVGHGGDCRVENIRTIIWAARRCMSRTRARRSTASGRILPKSTASARAR